MTTYYTEAERRVLPPHVFAMTLWCSCCQLAFVNEESVNGRPVRVICSGCGAYECPPCRRNCEHDRTRKPHHVRHQGEEWRRMGVLP